MELATLYDYYREQNVAPTFADFRDESAVRAYGRARAALLGDRLALPISFFRGVRILEFGPDTGENALVFARWGARLTLVEPALGAHAVIRTYFDRFAPPDALDELVVADVLTYDCPRPFDMIVAEGFIYTVQPAKRWLDVFHGALVPGGLALISYIERTASLFELMLRVPFATLQRREGCDRLSAAERLYRPKWDRIPHTRAFDSWAMDVLDNPFMRLSYFIDAGPFVAEAAAGGFGIHASWPSYRDGLENGWAKRPTPATARAAAIERHIARSILTFLLGAKAYLIDERDARELRALVDDVLADADALVDDDDQRRFLRLAATLRRLATAVTTVRTICDSPETVIAGARLLAAWADVHEALGAGETDVAVQRLRNDPVLLDGWGSPTHLAVLRAVPPAEAD